MVESSAYGVTVQGSAGDRLEPDYNMENNPLYEMSKGHKTQTPAAPMYETVDSGRVCFLSVGGMNEVSQTKCCFLKIFC